MASCHSYGGITEAEFDRLRAEIAAEGLTFPPSDSGVLEHRGVVISFVYSRPMQTLKVCIERKPFFVTESYIWQVLDSAIEPYADASPALEVRHKSV